MSHPFTLTSIQPKERREGHDDQVAFAAYGPTLPPAHYGLGAWRNRWRMAETRAWRALGDAGHDSR